MVIDRFGRAAADRVHAVASVAELLPGTGSAGRRGGRGGVGESAVVAAA